MTFIINKHLNNKYISRQLNGSYRSSQFFDMHYSACRMDATYYN